MNKLYFGDCLTVMQDMKLGSVDLIYLDPPFNSNRTYNSIYKDETGQPLPEQVDAFCDMWEMDAESERVVRAMPVLMREAGLDDSAAELWRLWMNALRHTQPRLLAYLSYMTQRLLVMQRLLKPTGSIYLHCDTTASHYLKTIMDAVFGHQNFRNEIVWCYPPGGRGPKFGFHRKHDTIFYYGRSSKSGVFNRPYKPLTDAAKAKYTMKDEDGRAYKQYPGGRTYLDEIPGTPIPDWWTDVHSLGQTQSKERMGYATQKPRALLERIIKASSSEGDVVLDPFAGCATTLEAAHILGRKWIGIDIAFHAVNRVIQNRLKDRCGLVEGKDYEVDGVPLTLEAARDLWQRDTYHFQQWAVEQVDGFVTAKRTADRGIDGRLYFYMPHDDQIHSMVLEVKGGRNVTIKVLRELRAVMDGDSALMAGLIVMEPLSAGQVRNFNRYMAEAGSLEVHGMQYPRMQILTVADILDGKRFKTPNVAAGRREAEPRLPV